MASSALPAGAGLLKNLTEASVAFTGNITNTSPIITTIASTSSLRRGQVVTGTGIPVGSRIISVDSGTQITIDQNATATTATLAITTAHGMLVGMPVISLPDILGLETYAPMTSADATTSEVLGAGVVTAIGATTYSVGMNGYQFNLAGTEDTNYVAPATAAVMTATVPVDGSGLYVVFCAKQITAAIRRVTFPGPSRPV
jgi:hypothetical protein